MFVKYKNGRGFKNYSWLFLEFWKHVCKKSSRIKKLYENLKKCAWFSNKLHKLEKNTGFGKSSRVWKRVRIFEKRNETRKKGKPKEKTKGRRKNRFREGSASVPKTCGKIRNGRPKGRGTREGTRLILIPWPTRRIDPPLRENPTSTFGGWEGVTWGAQPLPHVACWAHPTVGFFKVFELSFVFFNFFFSREAQLVLSGKSLPCFCKKQNCASQKRIAQLCIWKKGKNTLCASRKEKTQCMLLPQAQLWFPKRERHSPCFYERHIYASRKEEKHICASQKKWIKKHNVLPVSVFPLFLVFSRFSFSLFSIPDFFREKNFTETY